MAQHMLELLVRPARAAVLIDRSADAELLRLSFEFFSKIWGGRFGHIIPVDTRQPDDLTEFRLARSRPEFVYGVGLDDDAWRPAVVAACQPRGYGRLEPGFVRNRRMPRWEDYYTVDYPLTHLHRTRVHEQRHRRLQTVTADATSNWSLYCAAVFGVPHANLRQDLRDHATKFVENTAVEFIKLATAFVSECRQSWLDVTGHALHVSLMDWGHPSPTVVLVNEPVSDLALFWNLRSASDADTPAWVIPVPADSVTDDAVLDALKEWLLAFLPYGARPNFCLVTSATVSKDRCDDFGVRFQRALTGSPIAAVDYAPPRNRLPVAVPFEYVTPWPVDITGRTLTLQPPRPKAFESLGSPRSWVVDLRKDVKTGGPSKNFACRPTTPRSSCSTAPARRHSSTQKSLAPATATTASTSSVPATRTS